MKELVDAGAERIQLEDLGAWMPATTGNDEDFEFVVDVVNRMVDGVNARIGWHFCLGTHYGNTAGVFDELLEKTLTNLYPCKIDEFVLDFALRGMQDVGVLKTLPEGKDVAIGVIDVRVLHAETADEVAERIRRILTVVPPERVTLTTDCGLRVLPRIVARHKLRALAEGAAIVRRELTG